MNVRRVCRYETGPKREQRILPAEHAGAARIAYNWGLARRSQMYRQTGKSTNAIKQHRELNRLRKTDYP